MKSYRYDRCCVNCGDCVDDLSQMIEEAVEVTYATVLRHCRGLLDWASRVGYSSRADQGLTLRDDMYVSYHKSTFQGQPCYYVVWSGIEYIWVRDDDAEAGISRIESIPLNLQRGDPCARRRRSRCVSAGMLGGSWDAATSVRSSESASSPRQKPAERRPRRSS